MDIKNNDTNTEDLLFENPNRTKWKSVGHHVDYDDESEEDEDGSDYEEDGQDEEEESDADDTDDDDRYQIITDKLGNTLRILKVEE